MRAEKSFQLTTAFIFGTLFLLTCTNSFFWDTMHLASLQARWYYENDFRYLLLPEELDSGHPPLLGLLLAISWKIGGRSLLVSHLLMLPFICLMVWQAIELGKTLFKGSTAIWASALLLLNTTLLGQSVLVSPDILVFGFLFFTLNQIFKKHPYKIVLGTCLLSITSMRGMMCAFSLFVFEMVINLKQGNESPARNLFRVIGRYVPAGILILLFLSWHYLKTGWIAYHKDSPWSDAFVRVDLMGFFRNVVILVWRYLDFGNIFIWLFLGMAILFWRPAKKREYSKKTAQLGLLAVVFLVFLAGPQMLYAHLLSHRYLYPAIAALALFVYSLAVDNLPYRICRTAVLLSIIGLLSGNLWVYPDPIAKGWDSTLAHLPYYQLRKEAIAFIRANHIDPEKVGSAFPYEGDARDLDLSNTSYRFAGKDLDSNQFVLYSNISNDFSDAELSKLKNEWKVIRQFGSWPVRFVLYQKPSASLPE